MLGSSGCSNGTTVTYYSEKFGFQLSDSVLRRAFPSSGSCDEKRSFLFARARLIVGLRDSAPQSFFCLTLCEQQEAE